LAHVLGSGSAKEGTDHWWSQRVSAVALLILGVWFLVALLRLDGFDHDTVHAWAASPLNSVMLFLLGVTVAWHSALGIQVVIEDYVHGPFLKVVSLILNRFAHVFLAIAAAFAVLKIAIGGGA
jgi:succinate dehydrogenase / fumarate reductase membrane anchor subunit